MHQTDSDGEEKAERNTENDNLSDPKLCICAFANGCFREKTLKLFNEHKDVLVNCLILIN